ncbi:unnamed protein product, partial [Ectocarpus fasciculatus]
DAVDVGDGAAAAAAGGGGGGGGGDSDDDHAGGRPGAEESVAVDDGGHVEDGAAAAVAEGGTVGSGNDGDAGESLAVGDTGDRTATTGSQEGNEEDSRGVPAVVGVGGVRAAAPEEGRSTNEEMGDGDGARAVAAEALAAVLQAELDQMKGRLSELSSENWPAAAAAAATAAAAAAARVLKAAA